VLWLRTSHLRIRSRLIPHRCGWCTGDAAQAGRWVSRRIAALILADNADYCHEYLARVGAPANGYLSLPFTEDVELSMRLG
jgi:hypothetical protein